MLYEINDTGKNELKKRIKENNKLFFIFPFFCVIGSVI